MLVLLFYFGVVKPARVKAGLRFVTLLHSYKTGISFSPPRSETKFLLLGFGGNSY